MPKLDISRLRERLESPENLQATLETVERMSPDAVNGPRLVNWLREGIQVKDGRWEIRSALRAVSIELKPDAYLEIGVRRGWSMAQVVAGNPQVHAEGIDLWIPEYGSVPNPGPRFVQSEIDQAVPGHSAELYFESGSSHDILPEHHLPYDLITVDGDHTGPGAIADLNEAYRLLAHGGAIVFDDILPISDGGCSLREAWESTKREGFHYLEFTRPDMAPCGIAIDLR